jgi:hypothetical protein
MVINILPSRPERTPPCQPNFHAITTLGKNTTINSRRSICGDSTICVPIPMNKKRLHQMMRGAWRRLVRIKAKQMMAMLLTQEFKNEIDKGRQQHPAGERGQARQQHGALQKGASSRVCSSALAVTAVNNRDNRCQ